MAFSYQKSFFEATENVTSQLLHQLLDSQESAEKTALIRQVKTNPGDAAWASHWRFQAWLKGLKPEQGKALEGKSPSELALAWADSMKRSLPLVIFIANFDETLRTYKEKPGQPQRAPKPGRWRKKEGLRLNGLCVMDLDHVVETHNPDDVRKWWAMVSAHLDLKELGILFVYISASGDGAKVVFKARQDWGNLIDNQLRMAQLLGVSKYVDEKCKDGSRGHFITTSEDVIYLDETDIYTYYNEEFYQRFNALYRNGCTQATENNSKENPKIQNSLDHKPSLEYNGVAMEKIIGVLLGGKTPQDGTRHETMRDLAQLLRYICDNTPKKIMQAFETQPWIQDLIAEGDPVEATVEGACKLKYGKTKPMKLKEALLATGAFQEPTIEGIGNGHETHPLMNELTGWGQQIAQLFGVFPCLKELCHGMKLTAYPASLFVGAALFGTDMTRTWYYYYYDPEVERRLNYCIYIIGDPATGKSFANRLRKLLAAPLIASDKVSNDAINRYKKALKERGTSTKEQKKDALKAPEVIVRIHGARTANGVFIEDMNKAVEMVGDKEMHLHLLTFDSELDSSTNAAKGGQWIDKSTMELKAFHNEEDKPAV